MKQRSLATRIAVSSLLLIVVMLSALAIFVASRIGHTLDARAVADLTKQTELVVDMIAAYDQSLHDAADRIASAFSGYFPDEFVLDAASTMPVSGTEAPVMRSGKAVLDLDYGAVDRFTKATGGNATIFARTGDDFIRISTSVVKDDGTRAVGTLLGHSHPAYAAMMRGDTWAGKVNLFGKDTMTEYRPLKDAQGRVIGILYIGFDLSAGLQGLKDSIKKIKIGDTGYVFAFDNAPGERRGLMTIHPSMEGRNMLADENKNSSSSVRYLAGHPEGVYRYMYSADPGTPLREKIVVSREYKGWGWVVAAGTWVDEFSGAAIELRRILLGGTLAAGLLLATFLWLGLRRMVARPLAHAVKAAHAIASGDLDHDLQPRSMDETGQLLAALSQMNSGLARIVREVRSGTQTIASASSKIAADNRDLSARTQQQAGALQQTAASMEELSSTVQQNSDNAQRANQLAATASALAGKGGAAVSKVVDTMQSINESSKRIVDITAVIDSIAFQTNILALNAAVEAARAGDQGRGFAVVAAEVRSLAQRSAAAAREIKALIDDSVEKVATGGVQVDHAVTTMNEIVASISHVTDLMGEISVASQEQTDGIAQVHQAISAMDLVTQRNATLVGEASTLSKSMQDQAATLAQVISVFKVAAH
ncbi:MAG: Cache 3/Cache 2 fusion domain-containing protein [Pelomonas sp.]|nr:Cache 3/Cache 2 fusion domain-containing protein [Burkholderiaceae bacterium]MBV8605067.1 Cache 3/Cache 2 fusion domain-containing protein [Roseateles sp.]